MTADSLARIAALVGDAARARILLALFDDVEMRATELARRADVSAQTTSFHLSRLCDAGLLTGVKRGRWRVYSLAGPDVAAAIEALMVLTPANGDRRNQPLKSIELARTCYDHLAGRLGVSLADALVRQGWLEVAASQFVVTSQGADSFRAFGIDVAELRTLKRQFAKRCLDWTERRYHVAGSLGAAIVTQFKRRKWIVALKGSRVLHVTSDGYRGLRKTFGVAL
ncbi:MAG: ArsR/SmtB family transcription factor [Gemmatimonadaceae bacterium]